MVLAHFSKGTTGKIASSPRILASSPLYPAMSLRPKAPAQSSSTSTSLPSSRSSCDLCRAPTSTSSTNAGGNQRRVVAASVRFFSSSKMRAFSFFSLSFSLSLQAVQLAPLSAVDCNSSSERERKETNQRTGAAREEKEPIPMSALFLFPLSPPSAHLFHLLLPPASSPPSSRNPTNCLSGPPLRDRAGRHHGWRGARHCRGCGLGRRARGRPRRLLAVPGNRGLLLLRLLGERQPGFVLLLL